MDYVSAFIRDCGSLWHRTLNHPFVLAIEKGNLPVDSFKFYLIQDYLYLISYSRALAIASYKAPNLSYMKEMSDFLYTTLNTEMGLHRSYANEFGITDTELENAEYAPTMLAYTNYMLDIACRHDFLSNIVCILPCALGYAEIGVGIKKRQKLLEDSRNAGNSNPFQLWIDMYSSEEFVSYAQRLKAIANDLIEGLPERDLNKLSAIFRQSTKYEWMFWEMAWTLENWQV
jgi:thiaminase (transcriptional activator TenA)